MARFINNELKSDSDSELDSEEESKFDAGLMAKLKCSDSEQDILLLINFAHTFLLTLNKSFYC